MIRLATAKGLGDAILLRAIAEHLTRTDGVCVHTLWPDVFRGLAISVQPRPNFPLPGDVRIVSPWRHMDEGRTWWRACCASVGVEAELRMTWRVYDRAMIHDLRRHNRPLLVYQPPKRPKNPQQELLVPCRRAFADVVRVRMSEYYVVKVGHPRLVDDGDDMPCHWSAIGPDSVTRALDLCASADLLFGQSSCFIPHVAQALGRDIVVMFSERAMRSADPLVNHDLPEKLIERPSLFRLILSS